MRTSTTYDYRTSPQKSQELCVKNLQATRIQPRFVEVCHTS